MVRGCVGTQGCLRSAEQKFDKHDLFLVGFEEEDEEDDDEEDELPPNKPSVSPEE